jgi:thioredoxin-dependent peroxiredoxin
LNALVVGVSADKPATQLKFVEKFGLTFPVVPDPERIVIGVWGTRKVNGVTAQRSTFLVDPEGRIAHVWPKVSVDGHADDVIAKIRGLA